MIKPYYEKDGITIYHGDCIEVMKEFPDKSFDLVITDPPYGVLGDDFEWDDIDVKKFSQRWWNEVKRVSKDNSSAYVLWSQKYLREGLDIFNPHRILIWHHPNLAKPTNKMFLWTYTFIFYIKRGDPVFSPSFAKSENVDIFRFAKPQSNFKEDKKFHPTQKPLELIKIFVKISSDENSNILDPFMGSGTTLVAAKHFNRRAVGIEISKEYCDEAIKRLEGIQPTLF